MEPVDRNELYMEQMREDIARIRESQAVQNQSLTTIMQRLEQNAQSQAQQGAQIVNLTTQIEVMKAEYTAFHGDFTTKVVQILAWQSDAPTHYIPRKEHEASRHEERIKALEEARKSEGENRFSFLQWLMTNGLTILFFVIMFVLTVYNTFR